MPTWAIILIGSLNLLWVGPIIWNLLLKEPEQRFDTFCWVVSISSFVFGIASLFALYKWIGFWACLIMLFVPLSLYLFGLVKIRDAMERYEQQHPDEDGTHRSMRGRRIGYIFFLVMFLLVSTPYFVYCIINGMNPFYIF